jgi:hypothetical protein
MSNSRSSLRNTSTSAQCYRLLERLRLRPINSFQITSELNICRPGARIADLRSGGHNIHTRLTDLIDAEGYRHPRVATYSLLSAEVEA